jgi:hypothetical protein
MGEFYSSLSSLTQQDLFSLTQTYSAKNLQLFYNSYNITTETKSAYSVGDYISAINNSNKLIMNGKFFINSASPFGHCVKNNPVRFMVPIDKVSCGLKIV